MENSKILTLPNLLSLSRIPLACLFVFASPEGRFGCVLVAGVTDFLDGFLARTKNSSSSLGTVLDPIGDKFFVTVAIGTLWLEQRASSWAALSFFARDLALLFFTFYLFRTGKWGSYHFRSFWCGKLSTSLQLILLLGLVLNFTLPSALCGLLVLLGFLSYFELVFTSSRKKNYSLK